MLTAMTFASAPYKMRVTQPGDFADVEKEMSKVREEGDPDWGHVFKVTVDRGEELSRLGISMYDGAPELTGVITELAQNSLLQGTHIQKFDRLIALNGRPCAEIDRLMKIMKKYRSIELLVKRPKSYAFKVRKDPEFGLGLNLGYSSTDQFLLIQKINPGSIMQLNKQYKDREIRAFDAIVSVNGITGTADELIEEIEAKDCVTFGMMRWFSKDEMRDLGLNMGIKSKVSMR